MIKNVFWWILLAFAIGIIGSKCLYNGSIFPIEIGNQFILVKTIKIDNKNCKNIFLDYKTRKLFKFESDCIYKIDTTIYYQFIAVKPDTVKLNIK